MAPRRRPTAKPMTSAPSDTTATEQPKPVPRKRRMSWGMLKLRFSDRHKEFDESRDS